MSQHGEQENLADVVVALVNEKTTVKYAWHMKAIIIIIITAVISIAPDRTDMGTHTALYKINKNESINLIKTSIITLSY